MVFFALLPLSAVAPQAPALQPHGLPAAKGLQHGKALQPPPKQPQSLAPACARRWCQTSARHWRRVCGTDECAGCPVCRGRVREAANATVLADKVADEHKQLFTTFETAEELRQSDCASLPLS